MIVICSTLLLALIISHQTPSVRPEDQKQTLLDLINQYRVSNGKNPLKISPSLSIAAQAHSEDMANHNYFSHNSIDGRTPWDRMRQTGYTYNTWLGENIAAGYSTAQGVFEAWKTSPYGHNEVMLFDEFKVIGIGLAYNAFSDYKYYWTADFGGYDDTGTSPPPQPPQPPPSQPPSGPMPQQPEKIPTSIMLYDLPGEINMSDIIEIRGRAEPTGVTRLRLILRSPSGNISDVEIMTDPTGQFRIFERLNEKGNWTIEVLNPGNDTRKTSNAIHIVTVKLFFLITTVSPYQGSIIVDGVSANEGIQRFVWESGSKHQIEAMELMRASQWMYRFISWQDGSRDLVLNYEVRGPDIIFAIYEKTTFAYPI